jgi:RES domain-containing protein
VYRVLRQAYGRAPFDGEGAYLYGGRWSNPGTRLSYTSEHQSLAMLEYFVHLDADDAPEDLTLGSAEVPDDLSREQIELADLPPNWRETPAPPELARLGDDFIRTGQHCLLIVPSVLAKTEKNWLLNPRHPEFPKIAIRASEPLSYDARMFGRTMLGRATMFGRTKRRGKHTSR